MAAVEQSAAPRTVPGSRVVSLRLPLVLAALVLTTACGSTVQSSGPGTGAAQSAQTGLDPLGGAVGDPGAAGLLGADGLSLPPSADPAGSAAGTVPTTAEGGDPAASTGTPGPAGSASAPASGTATSTDPIKVGIPYIDAEFSNAFVSGIGAGLATGDFKAGFEQRLAELNERGGILGRKVVGVYHELDPNAQPGQYEQSACAAFTDDEPVQYVFDPGLGGTFLSCLAAAGVGVLNYSQSLLTRRGLNSYPGFILPDSVALDRLAEAQAERFQEMGYFGDLKTTKVGILFYDHPEFIAAEKVLEQALAQRGIAVAARQAMRYVASTSDVSQTAQEANSAVLRFRSAGVTHVLAVEQNAWLTGFFGINAASQNYYPRYGYTSQEPLGNIAANVPERALQDALFFGWNPVADVPDLDELTPAGRTCLAAFRNFEQQTPNQRGTYTSVCESVDLLEAAVTAAGTSTGAATLVNGAAMLEDFASSNTFRVIIRPGETDGVKLARDGKWDSASRQFVYTSAPKPL